MIENKVGLNDNSGIDWTSAQQFNLSCRSAVSLYVTIPFRRYWNAQCTPGTSSTMLRDDVWLHCDSYNERQQL